jgi:hypothetical protein
MLIATTKMLSKAKWDSHSGIGRMPLLYCIERTIEIRSFVG